MLGDSYSSGEGFDNTYYPGSAVANENECHRSTESWEANIRDRMQSDARIASGQWLFAACSGDEINHMMYGSKKDYTSPPIPQVNFLNTGTRFVTMTIGGNDVGFEKLLETCARSVWTNSWMLGASETDCNSAKSRADSTIGGTSAELRPNDYLGARLLALYREILRRAPFGRLTILTYPMIFPTQYDGIMANGTEYCDVGYSELLQKRVGYRDSDVQLFAGYNRRLNEQIVLAVKTLIDQGMGDRISLVRLDQGEVATHTVRCGDSRLPTPYINAFRQSARGTVSFASFHPNADGQAAYANLAYPTASTFSRPLSVAVSGPTTFATGQTVNLTLAAKSGSPTWNPSPYSVDAKPYYSYGFSNITPGLTVTGTVPNLQVTAATPGSYAFTASATDSRGTRVEKRVTITVNAKLGEPAPGNIARYKDGSTYYIDKTGWRHALSGDPLVACHGGTSNIVYAGDAAWSRVLARPLGEPAACFTGVVGDLIRHSDGDAYVLGSGASGLQRRWVPTASTYACERSRGRPVVTVARYHVQELAPGADLAPYNCMVRAPEGDIHFINNEGKREWVPDGPTLSCEQGRGVELIGTTRAFVDSVTEVGWHYCLYKPAFYNKVLRHAAGDAHYIHPDETRTWIPDGPTWDCRLRQGKPVLDTHWREYVNAFRDTGWDYCYDIETLKNRIMVHPEGDAHFVDGAGVRHYIASYSTWDCLKARGIPEVTVRWREYINRTPERDWAVCGDTLYPNQRLDRGQWLRSSDGRYNLHMQTDGNLVLYNPSWRAIWATNRGGDFTVLQGDGNLVEYGSSGAVWASNTVGRGGNRLVVQSDGNLVLYSPNGAVWWTGTVGR